MNLHLLRKEGTFNRKKKPIKRKTGRWLRQYNFFLHFSSSILITETSLTREIDKIINNGTGIKLKPVLMTFLSALNRKTYALSSFSILIKPWAFLYTCRSFHFIHFLTYRSKQRTDLSPPRQTLALISWYTTLI